MASIIGRHRLRSAGWQRPAAFNSCARGPVETSRGSAAARTPNQQHSTFA